MFAIQSSMLLQEFHIRVQISDINSEYLRMRSEEPRPCCIINGRVEISKDKVGEVGKVSNNEKIQKKTCRQARKQQWREKRKG